MKISDSELRVFLEECTDQTENISIQQKALNLLGRLDAKDEPEGPLGGPGAATADSDPEGPPGGP